MSNNKKPTEHQPAEPESGSDLIIAVFCIVVFGTVIGIAIHFGFGWSVK